jgi:di/tricarboxylate transporter
MAREKVISPGAVLAPAGLGLGVWIALGDPFGLGPEAASAAGLVIGAIALYATGVVAEHVTALLFFAVAMVFALAPAELVFSGFASKAFWLVLSGLVIGQAVNVTGLGARLARKLAALFPDGYGGLVAGMVAVAMVFAFFMPSSMGRIVLLMPIAMALAARYGLAEGSTGRAGIALITGFACFNPPNGVLPATVPNMVYVGAVEKAYGAAPLYGEWLLLHFPLLGLAKAVLIALVGYWLFRQPAARQVSEEAPAPMSGAERRLAAVLALALIGWATDVVHGISPAWIGLAAACVLLLPRIGVLDKAAFKQIDPGPPIYVAGILALGALIAETGLGDRLGATIAEILPLNPGAGIVNYFTLALGGGAISLGTTMPGLPAVMVPLAEPLAEASGLPLETVLASVVLSYSTTLLPYQAPPIVVAIAMAGARTADAVKLVGLVALISFAVILPLNFLWWRVLGLI